MYYKKTCLLVCLLMLTCILPFSAETTGSQAVKQINSDENYTCNCGISSTPSVPYSNIIIPPTKLYTSGATMIPDWAEPDEWDDSNIGSLPTFFDWRDYMGKDWTTSIKNQGACGSCWDFAAMGALESRIKIKNNLPDLDIDLSEQYVLSCGNVGGCDGSCAFLAYYFMKKNGGAIPESCFPYYADDTISCSMKCSDWNDRLIPLLSYGFWYKPSLKFIKHQLINNGPLVSSFVIKDNFFDYDGGYVYEHPGEETFDPTNHEVVIIGYDDAEQCWICKNSWGKYWGETKDFEKNTNYIDGGWLRIAYGDCKIGTTITYVNVDEVPLFHVKILEPREGLYQNNQEVWSMANPAIVFGSFDVKVEAYNSESDIEKVEFYFDSKLKNTDYSAPFSWNCNEKAILNHKIKAVVYSKNGDRTEEEIPIVLLNLGSGYNQGALLTGYPYNENYKKWCLTGFIPELLYNPQVTDSFWGDELFINYVFTFGDGQKSEIKNIKSASYLLSHNYEYDNTYNAYVEITIIFDHYDDVNFDPPLQLHCENKGTGRMIFDVNKDYIPLSVDASGPASGKTNTVLQFEGLADGGKPPYHYSWDFDINDGINEDSSEQNPTYTYNKKNTYVVTLTVTDDKDNKVMDKLELTISSKNSAKPKFVIFYEKLLLLIERFFHNVKHLYFFDFY